MAIFGTYSEVDMAGRYWSTAEVADLLTISKQTVLNMWKRGELTGAEQLSNGRSSLVIPVDTVEELRQEKIKKLRAELEKLEAAEVA